MAGARDIGEIIGRIPHRLALAGGWIDQPFVSRHDPDPPGSMVVVGVEPDTPFMDRCGIASSTRKVAMRIWNGRLPDGDRMALVRELYRAENEGKPDPSGSQDMAGLVYPGVNRLDYDYRHEGGVFPRHVESHTDPDAARWLERVIHIVAVMPRPETYNPLGEKHLDPVWVRRLGRSGKNCYDAILKRDAQGLGESLTENMRCWGELLPHALFHPSMAPEMPAILEYYQTRYLGAMWSGCGGGYVYVVSEEPVPGGFHITVRTG